MAGRKNQRNIPLSEKKYSYVLMVTKIFSKRLVSTLSLIIDWLNTIHSHICTTSKYSLYYVVLYLDRYLVTPVLRSHNEKAKLGGFINTKETCNISSMMQALASSTKLINLMASFSSSERLTKLIKILTAINSPVTERQSSEDITKQLIELLSSVPNLKTDDDALQSLSFILDSIQSDFEEKHTIMPPKFRILRNFSENCKSNKIENLLALSLPLRGNFKERPGVDLKSLLDAFFEPSKDGTDTQTIHLFEKAPQVLILHIQANQWSSEFWSLIKSKYYINYPGILDYEFKIHRKKDGSQGENVKVQYRLVAVVQHMGDPGGGHYVTYRMHGDHWYLTNDDEVVQTYFQYNVVPYIMVYEKIF